MPGKEPRSLARMFPRVLYTLSALLILCIVWLAWQKEWFTAPIRVEPRVVTLYGFSTFDAVMKDAVFPAFRRYWKEEQGEDVEFVATFAGSGELTSRIIRQYPAQIAIVSSELDAHRLAYTSVRWESWRELPHGGILAGTPMVIVTREGNPKEVKDFGDLVQAGLQVVHCDPSTSGGANLAILAEYGSALHSADDPELAFQQLLGTWKNVTIRTSSARESRRRFEQGEGDVVVTYEQDVLRTPSTERIRGEILYPPRTLMAQPTVVIISRNIARRESELIDAFVQFLWTRETQQALVDYGFHSVYPELDVSNRQLGRLAEPLTLADFGSPGEVRRQILQGIWRDRVLPQLPQP